MHTLRIPPYIPPTSQLVHPRIAAVLNCKTCVKHPLYPLESSANRARTPVGLFPPRSVLDKRPPHLNFPKTGYRARSPSDNPSPRFKKTSKITPGHLPGGVLNSNRSTHKPRKRQKLQIRPYAVSETQFSIERIS